MISGTTFYIIERESDAGHDMSSILGPGDEFENTNGHGSYMLCRELAQQRPCYCQACECDKSSIIQK
jgi:hypothetical protein